jgi:Zn finger protein HypA/HybF involved in hydrogenase expression
MHEITFAKSVIDEIKDKGNVESIEIEVGELAEVTAEDLKQAIETITGWKVRVKEMESKVKCKCGYIGRANIKEKGHDVIIYNCPKCSSLPKPIIGQDIKLKRVVYY